MDSIFRDLRLAARSLVKAPAFSIVAALTLALGIGTNTAIFSVVDAALLRPLPFANPARLVHVWERSETSQIGRSEASYPDFVDWRAQQTTFAGIAGYQTNGATVTGTDAPFTVPVTNVTSNFFDLLGVHPEIGRTFRPGEEGPDGAFVVLSYELWQGRFGGDRTVLGRTLTVDALPHTIIGVLPRDFYFIRSAQAGLWKPINPSPNFRDRRGSHWLNVIARLRDDVTPERAFTDLSTIMRRLADSYPVTNTGRGIIMSPLRDAFVGNMRPLLLALVSAVALLLLVACANVAGLLIARATSRRKELAVRVALGADRRRLVQQMLAESLLLSTVGGALGIAIAVFAIRAALTGLSAAQLVQMPYLQTVHVDGRMLLYAVGMVLATAVAFGLLPAFQASSVAPQDALRQSSRGSSGSRHAARRVLVAGEVAVTLVLLVGAGLMGRSLVRLLQVDPGFRSEHVLTARVGVSTARYPTQAQQQNFFSEFERRVGELPGVAAKGYTTKLPLDFGNSSDFAVVGRPEPLPGKEPEASVRDVSGGYFDALGIPLIRGRTFTDRDDSTTAKVIVVNRALVDAIFPGEDALGKQLDFAANAQSRWTIVGVVGNVPIGNIGDPSVKTVYYPYRQDAMRNAAMVVRSSVDPATMTESMKRILHDLDPDIPLGFTTTMDNAVAQSAGVFTRRYPLMLMSAFALVALVLAVVGIYGVISYSVTQRTQELGIRSALGARPRDVLTLVLREGLMLAVAGVVAGSVIAFGATQFLQSLLFGVAASDPLVYASVAALLVGTAVAASSIPAWRAMKLDPLTALRAGD